MSMNNRRAGLACAQARATPLPPYAILRKTGSRRSGYESDGGPVYHAVPAGSFRALCGTEPGDRSDWSTCKGDAVTCAKCKARLARAEGRQA